MPAREDLVSARRSAMSQSAGQRRVRFLLIAVLASFVPTVAFAAWTESISVDIWAMRPTAKETRWLVIHNRDSAIAEGLFHVEVLALAKGAEPWRVRHLARHLALTEEALRASIVKPLRRGAVYPESFDDAYAQWREQSNAGSAPICRSSVFECLK